MEGSRWKCNTTIMTMKITKNKSKTFLKIYEGGMEKTLGLIRLIEPFVFSIKIYNSHVFSFIPLLTYLKHTMQFRVPFKVLSGVLFLMGYIVTVKAKISLFDPIKLLLLFEFLYFILWLKNIKFLVIWFSSKLKNYKNRKDKISYQEENSRWANNNPNYKIRQMNKSRSKWQLKNWRILSTYLPINFWNLLTAKVLTF